MIKRLKNDFGLFIIPRLIVFDGCYEVPKPTINLCFCYSRLTTFLCRCKQLISTTGKEYIKSGLRNGNSAYPVVNAGRMPSGNKRIPMYMKTSTYLEITRNSDDLKKIVEQGMLAPDSMELKAAKYILIELA